MTFKNDQFSADALAAAMENVLGSAEHKEMFKKEAQVAGQHMPGAATGISTTPGTPTSTSTQGKGGAGTTYVSDPGQAGTGAMAPTAGEAKQTQQWSKLSGDLQSQLEQIVAQPHLAGISGAEQLAANILAGKASVQDLTSSKSKEMAGLLSALGVKPNSPEEKPMLAQLNSINNNPPKKIADLDIINTLVKIADYLGDNEYLFSEAIADDLIKSIIVEAKKKGKKDKKFNKKMKKDMPNVCKECKCDPCDCE